MKPSLANTCTAILLVAALSVLALSEEPQTLSACNLKENAGAYNHRLIQVTSFVSHGFEDFSLQEPSCDMKLNVWLEYGGKSASGTMYCCGVTNARTRPDPVMVEDIPIPLVEDANFRAFDRLIQVRGSYAMVHATLVGRFFSGREIPDPNGKRWGGYGHMGCCSLLVIERVLAVDPQDRNDLDYESFVDQPDLEKLKCGTYQDLMEILPYRDMLKAQQRAESDEEKWAFDDPERAAITGLANLLKREEKSIAGMKEVRRSQGKVIYEWHPKGRTRYMIVVNRPYWLSFYSHREGRVAWVVAAAYRECGD